MAASGHVTSTVTSPASVNLMALPTRLMSTWRSRSASPTRASGTSGATRHASSSDRWWARRASICRVSPSMSRSANGLAFRSSLPASIFEKSRMSFMIRSSASAEFLTMPRNCRCSGSSGVARTSSVMPMMPFIGVRTSWLMLARNSLLARLAASAASLALARSIVCRWTRRRSVITQTRPAITTAARPPTIQPARCRVSHCGGWITAMAAGDATSKRRPRGVVDEAERSRRSDETPVTSTMLPAPTFSGAAPVRRSRWAERAIAPACSRSTSSVAVETRSTTRPRTRTSPASWWPCSSSGGVASIGIGGVPRPVRRSTASSSTGLKSPARGKPTASTRSPGCSASTPAPRTSRAPLSSRR